MPEVSTVSQTMTETPLPCNQRNSDPSGPVEIRMQNVHKAFNDHQVLKGVSLEVRRGEIVALVGGSGCGKTVLLDHIIGHLQPDEVGVVHDVVVGERGRLGTTRRAARELDVDGLVELQHARHATELRASGVAREQRDLVEAHEPGARFLTQTHHPAQMRRPRRVQATGLAGG